MNFDCDLGEYGMALDADRAEKPVRKLRKLLKKMPAVPNADDIHDFRTSSRRIEATIHALSLDSGQNGRRFLKQSALLHRHSRMAAQTLLHSRRGQWNDVTPSKTTLRQLRNQFVSYVPGQ